MISLNSCVFLSRKVNLCAVENLKLCSINFSIFMVLLFIFYSTVGKNPEATGRCGTRLWWQRHCLPSPTSSAPCASSAFSLPTLIWAPYRSHWAACSWTSSSSSSSTVQCCWPLPMGSTSSTFTMKRMRAMSARVFAVISKTTPSQRKLKFLNKLSLTKYELFIIHRYIFQQRLM